jgi:hypothetical protein
MKIIVLDKQQYEKKEIEAAPKRIVADSNQSAGICG